MNSNPQMRAMAESSPEMRAMLSNPEAMRQIMNPETMQAMINMQRVRAPAHAQCAHVSVATTSRSNAGIVLPLWTLAESCDL